MHLCNYFNYSPNILRIQREVDEEAEVCRGNRASIIFMAAASVLTLFHPQGIKPWLLNSLMFTKEKEKEKPMIILRIMIALIIFFVAAADSKIPYQHLCTYLSLNYFLKG